MSRLDIQLYQRNVIAGNIQFFFFGTVLDRSEKVLLKLNNNALASGDLPRMMNLRFSLY